jgi:hypothetical protein
MSLVAVALIMAFATTPWPPLECPKDQHAVVTDLVDKPTVWPTYGPYAPHCIPNN